MDETTTAPVPEAAPPPLGLVARVVGVITSPKATFERIVPAPRIAGILLIMAVLTGLTQGLFLMTERGQQAWLDSQVQASETLTKQPMPPEAYARMEKMAPYMAYAGMGGSLVFLPLVLAFEAGVFYVVFTFGTGGTASFKQVMAVVTHATVVSVLGLLFTVLMQFVRGTMSLTGPANAGVLFPMLEDTGWLSHFLGLIDLFRIWWVITLAIGLGVLYKRKARNIAISLFVVYGVIAGGVAYFLSGR